MATDGTDLYVVGESRSFSTPVGNAVGENDVVLLRFQLNAPPTADPGPDQTVPGGGTAVLDGTGSADSDGTIASYAWDFGDGTGYTETAGDAPDGDFDGVTTHAYDDNGTFTLTLTVTDDQGASSFTTTTVTVTNVAPVVDAGPDQSVLQGDPLTIAATFDDPGRALGETYTASIDWGDGTVTSGLADTVGGKVSGSHVYTDAGNFTFVVTVTDDGDPACTATGRCLNFVVGARKDFAAVFGPETIRWANDYRGFKGYIDRFTLGIDGKSVTYNFEPAAGTQPPKIIELSNKEAAHITPDSNDLVKITGTVVDRTNAMFALDDGSGCVIQGFLYKDIKTPENPAKVGERWSVWGHVEKVPFQPADGPPLIWTCVSHMTKL